MTYDTINDASTITGNSTGKMLANRYRVVRHLGSGGMGSAWLVEDVKLENNGIGRQSQGGRRRRMVDFPCAATGRRCASDGKAYLCRSLRRGMYGDLGSEQSRIVACDCKRGARSRNFNILYVVRRTPAVGTLREIAQHDHAHGLRLHETLLFRRQTHKPFTVRHAFGGRPVYAKSSCSKHRERDS